MAKSSSDKSDKTSIPSNTNYPKKQTAHIRLEIDPVNTPNMSMFGFGRPQPSSAEKIAAAEQEMDLVTDMFNKLTKACMKKCIPADYREGELNKGESVCIDRCTAKFFEVQMKVSEILQAEAQAKGAGGGGGGMGGPFGGM